MGGRYGNKGAILARFVIDDSSICFLNCHLAVSCCGSLRISPYTLTLITLKAGQRATRQRNKDLIDILENKAAFLHPSGALPGVYIGGNGQTVFEHEICFLSSVPVQSYSTPWLNLLHPSSPVATSTTVSA